MWRGSIYGLTLDTEARKLEYCKNLVLQRTRTSIRTRPAINFGFSGSLFSQMSSEHRIYDNPSNVRELLEMSWR
jgi:hypothetical protein